MQIKVYYTYIQLQLFLGTFSFFQYFRKLIFVNQILFKSQ